LRRSPVLKSLIFPHGLLPFSAKSRQRYTIRARTLASLQRPQPQRDAQLCLFLLAFWNPAALQKRAAWVRNRAFVADANNGMMLLIFAASLLHHFRIVITVTILQQRVTAWR
jgi:hypothetical protein